MSFNHKPSIFSSFTVSSHQSGRSAFVRHNLPEKGGTDRQKEKETLDLAESQVPVSSEEVWSIHWERWFPCESGPDVHRNLPYSPEVGIRRVTGCVGQWGQRGSEHEGSTLKFVCPVVAVDGKVRFSSLTSPAWPCDTSRTLEANFSSIQNFPSAVVCIVCVFSLIL